MKLPTKEVPTDVMTDIVRFYKQGTPVEAIAEKYKWNTADLILEIGKHTRLNGRDKIVENMNLLQMAEVKLIEMAKEIKNGSTTGMQLCRYNALLFWYTKADLNEGIVFIPKKLLL